MRLMENKNTPVIAKIEKHEAIDHYEDILDATAILALTQSGRTAKHISRFRPKQFIIAFTPSLTTMRRLSLFRGINPRLILDPRDTDDMIEKVSKRAVETGDLSERDLAVITAGHPVWVAGKTNMIRVKRCRVIA